MYEVYFSEKHGQRAVRAPSPTRDAALNLQDPQLPSRAASVRPGHFGQDQVCTLERRISGLSHEPWRMATQVHGKAVHELAFPAAHLVQQVWDTHHLLFHSKLPWQ